MQKLKQGDEVIVLIGKDKGKRGRISKFLNDKVMVEGVNQVKKHQKP
jgi:large subunit ribosomal protein L24